MEKKFRFYITNKYGIEKICSSKQDESLYLKF